MKYICKCKSTCVHLLSVPLLLSSGRDRSLLQHSPLDQAASLSPSPTLQCMKKRKRESVSLRACCLFSLFCSRLASPLLSFTLIFYLLMTIQIAKTSRLGPFGRKTITNLLGDAGVKMDRLQPRLCWCFLLSCLSSLFCHSQVLWLQIFGVAEDTFQDPLFLYGWKKNFSSIHIPVILFYLSTENPKNLLYTGKNCLLLKRILWFLNTNYMLLNNNNYSTTMLFKWFFYALLRKFIRISKKCT